MTVAIDLINQKFGRLTVVSRDDNHKNGQTRWKCLCDCGSYKVIKGVYLRDGRTTSCGCLRTSPVKIGEKYGNLLVLCLINNITKSLRFKCLCDCGKETEVSDYLLKKGMSASCGCIDSILVRALSKPRGADGLSQVFASYRSNALRRNYTFKLSIDQLESLTKENCFYCNSEPSNRSVRGSTQEIRDHGGYIYNGIDRMDNTKGYSLDNCVACCSKCNIAKSDMSTAEFIEHNCKINNHLKKVGVL